MRLVQVPMSGVSKRSGDESDHGRVASRDRSDRAFRTCRMQRRSEPLWHFKFHLVDMTWGSEKSHSRIVR
jgi:hypothetical protein